MMILNYEAAGQLRSRATAEIASEMAMWMHAASIILYQQSIQKETNMKCYTVTKDGVVPGIRFLREPYPHVAVGDPALSSADCRRVEVDAALAGGAESVIKNCSHPLDSK